MKKLLFFLLSAVNTLNAYDITINNTTDYPVKIYIGAKGKEACPEPNHGPGSKGLAPHTADWWPTHSFLCLHYVEFHYPIVKYDPELKKNVFWGFEGNVSATINTVSSSYNNFEIYADIDANGIPQFHWR